jgi:hypothetical protein
MQFSIRRELQHYSEAAKLCHTKGHKETSVASHKKLVVTDRDLKLHQISFSQ